MKHTLLGYALAPLAMAFWLFVFLCFVVASCLKGQEQTDEDALD